MKKMSANANMAIAAFAATVAANAMARAASDTAVVGVATADNVMIAAAVDAYNAALKKMNGFFNIESYDTDMTTINLHKLEADLRPLVKEAMKKKKTNNDDIYDDNQSEAFTFAQKMLDPLVSFIQQDIEIENMNKANINYGDNPEIACLKNKKLVVKSKITTDSYAGKQLYTIDKHMAVRIERVYMSNSDSLESQLEMEKEAGELGISPKILDTFVCTATRNKHFLIIIYENIFDQETIDIQAWFSKTIDKKKKAAMRAKVRQLIKKMHANSLYHNQMYWNNVMFITQGGRPYVIGWESGTRSPTDSGKSIFGRDEHSDFGVLRSIDDDYVFTSTSKHVINSVVRRALEKGILNIETT